MAPSTYQLRGATHPSHGADTSVAPLDLNGTIRTGTA